MDEKLVELWAYECGLVDEAEADWDYNEECSDKYNPQQLLESMLEFTEVYGTNNEIWDITFEEYIIPKIKSKNNFENPITEEQYQLLIENSNLYGSPSGYDLFIGISSEKALIQEEEIFGRKIIMGSYEHPDLSVVKGWKAVVWDNDFFDEVVSVPEDLQAVDLHDAYQFGQIVEHGEDYIICHYEDEYVRIHF